MPAMQIGPAADRPTLSGVPSGPASSKANENAESRAMGAEASSRRALNAQILQSSMEVSIKAGDDAQALLFRTAIDRINEHLAPEFGAEALQSAAAKPEDHTAAATAERILAFSTGFFDTYAAQRPDADPETVAKEFVDLIRGGFEQGFGEARDILEGLGVFADSVKEGVMQTYELVNQGLDDFLASKLPPPAAAE